MASEENGPEMDRTAAAGLSGLQAAVDFCYLYACVRGHGIVLRFADLICERDPRRRQALPAHGRRHPAIRGLYDRGGIRCRAGIAAAFYHLYAAGSGSADLVW